MNPCYSVDSNCGGELSGKRVNSSEPRQIHLQQFATAGSPTLGLTRFKNKMLASHFRCRVCQGVCQPPFTECIVCSSMYCLSCCGSVVCSYCDSPNLVSSRQNSSLTAVYETLEVRCGVPGCRQFLPLKHLEEHESHCKAKLSLCVFAQQGVPQCLGYVPAGIVPSEYCSESCQMVARLVDLRTKTDAEEFLCALVEVLKFFMFDIHDEQQ